MAWSLIIGPLGNLFLDLYFHLLEEESLSRNGLNSDVPGLGLLMVSQPTLHGNVNNNSKKSIKWSIK